MRLFLSQLAISSSLLITPSTIWRKVNKECFHSFIHSFQKEFNAKLVKFINLIVFRKNYYIGSVIFISCIPKYIKRNSLNLWYCSKLTSLISCLNDLLWPHKLGFTSCKRFKIRIGWSSGMTVAKCIICQRRVSIDAC